MSTPKKMSRPQRWQDACSRASIAASDLESALSELVDIQSEYEEWKDSLPENLEQSALGENLQTLCDIDLGEAQCRAVEIIDAIQEAEDAELPRGFGRD